jgi:hypothetical protein
MTVPDERVGPGEPGPEPMRAKEIKNSPCILKPIKIDTEEEGKDGAWDYVLCAAWELDRSGVVRHEPELRISWKRARPQLEDRIGKYVMCKPKELDSGGVILVDLDGEQLAVAERVVDELTSGAPAGGDDGKPF